MVLILKYSSYRMPSLFTLDFHWPIAHDTSGSLLIFVTGFKHELFYCAPEKIIELKLFTLSDYREFSVDNMGKEIAGASNKWESPTLQINKTWLNKAERVSELRRVLNLPNG